MTTKRPRASANTSIDLRRRDEPRSLLSGLGSRFSMLDRDPRRRAVWIVGGGMASGGKLCGFIKCAG